MPCSRYVTLSVFLMFALMMLPSEQIDAEQRGQHHSCASPDAWSLVVTSFNIIVGRSSWDSCNDTCSSFVTFMHSYDSSVLDKFWSRTSPCHMTVRVCSSRASQSSPGPYRAGIDYLHDSLSQIALFPTCVILRACEIAIHLVLSTCTPPLPNRHFTTPPCHMTVRTSSDSTRVQI
jgi:hypothetical protein